jgi:hypothetical protein
VLLGEISRTWSLALKRSLGFVEAALVVNHVVAKTILGETLFGCGGVSL